MTAPRSAHRRYLSRGKIIALALILGFLTGPLWAGAPAHASTGSGAVFAGRAGMLPPTRPATPGDRAVRRVVGTTLTGCVLAFFASGFDLGDTAFGCAGGAASNIPWG